MGCPVRDGKKKKDQSGVIANIYDEMMKEIMPLSQKPLEMLEKISETKSPEKVKEDEKKHLTIFVDSVS